MLSMYIRRAVQLESRNRIFDQLWSSNRRFLGHAALNLGQCGSSDQPTLSDVFARQYSSQRPLSVAMSRRRRIGARVPSRSPLARASSNRQAPPHKESLTSTTNHTAAIDSALATQDGDKLFPVLAIHIAQTIDLSATFTNMFARDFIKKQRFNKNSFVVQLPPHAPQDHPRYVAVFRFGSVVCINMSPRERAQLVSDIKKQHATEPVLEGSERTERFGIMLLKPERHDHHGALNSDDALLDSEAAGTASQVQSRIVTGDYCVVPELDMNGVAVISNILAQTVALD